MLQVFFSERVDLFEKVLRDKVYLMEKNVFAKSLINMTMLVTLSAVTAGCMDKTENNAAAPGKSELSDFTVNQQALDLYMGKNHVDKKGPRYTRLAQSYLERNALAQVITEQDSMLTPEVLFEVRNSRNNALIKAYLDDYVSRTIDDKAVEKFYNDNIQTYSTAKVKAAGILISTAGLNEGERAKQREKAVSVAEKARKQGDFSQLAKEYSDDKTTAQKGGELGWISSSDSQNGELVKALTSVEAGGVTDPVETEKGFYILKLEEKPVTEKKEFAEVKDKIAYQLKYEARTKEVKRLKALAEKQVKADMDRLNIE